MPVVSGQVNALANAYRAAMREGDEQFASRPVERRILQAIVAASAADQLIWVQTRVDDGHAVGRPLAELAPALSTGDVVGTGLRAVEKKVFGVAKSAVTSIIATATWPSWVVGVAGAIVGYAIVAQDLGFTVGKGLFAVLAGGGAAVGALVRAAQVSPAVARSIGGAAGSLLDRTESIGGDAEKAFTRAVAPSLTALRPGPAATPVVGRLRGWGKALVLTSYTVLAIGLIAFAAGVYHGFAQGADQPCRTTIGTTCLK